MAVIRSLARTATDAARPALRGLNALVDPDAGAQRLAALDRRLGALESKLDELCDLDRRVSTLVRAEIRSRVGDELAPVAADLSAIRDELAEVRETVEHLRTEQAAARAEAS